MTLTGLMVSTDIFTRARRQADKQTTRQHKNTIHDTTGSKGGEIFNIIRGSEGKLAQHLSFSQDYRSI